MTDVGCLSKNASVSIRAVKEDMKQQTFDAIINPENSLMIKA